MKVAVNCKRELNSIGKMTDHIDYLQTFVLLLQFMLILSKNKPTITETTACRFFHDIVAFSILSFQPLEYDTPTDDIMVGTSGKQQPANFFCVCQLRTNFSVSE